MIYAGRYGTGATNAYPDTYAFTAIAATVVGGVSIFGGSGAVWRGTLGILTFALIGNGLNLLGVDTTYQQTILGLLIFAGGGGRPGLPPLGTDVATHASRRYPPMSPAEGSLVIRNALVFDGMSEELVPGSIRIDAGRIVEIGAVASQDCPSLDAAGSVVTPGLIDGHFHAHGISLNMLEMEGSRTSYVALQGATRLTRALKRGFTTVRDAAGGDIGLARALDEGLVSGPSYLLAGPALSQTGGHGDGRQAHLDVSAGSCHSVEVVDGVDRLRVAVRERLRTGASLIKIMASGGVVSPSDPIRVPQYSAEEIRAVTDEATRRGSYVAAHAYSPEAIRHAVTNGVRSIEHGNLLDDFDGAPHG